MDDCSSSWNCSVDEVDSVIGAGQAKIDQGNGSSAKASVEGQSSGMDTLKVRKCL
jgi:hypothetical protein